MNDPITIPASHPHLAKFRLIGEELSTIACPQDMTPLESVAMIGAHYHSNGEYEGLAPRDEIWLYHTLNFCRSSGIPVTENFHLTPVDLANGHDILDPHLPVKADILAVCLIIDPSTPAGRKHLINSSLNTGTLTSPRHHQNEWQQAAKRVGAKLISVFSCSQTFTNNRSEIDVSIFRSQDYIVAPMQQSIMAPDHSRGLEANLRYDMGILIDTKYMAALERAKPSFRQHLLTATA